MNSNILYSKILNRGIQLKSTINYLFNIDYANENRINSFAQKLRKKTLYSVFNEKSEINYESINRFSKILNYENLNLFDYLNYNFKEKFSEKKYINKNISFLNKKKITKTTQYILNLIEENIFENLTIIIHGSHADGEITNYSDIDISIFIKTNSIVSLDQFKETYRQIETINRKISFYDPIGHHKAFLNLESDLDCYPESFMPVKVLSEGLIPSKQKIKFKSTRNDLDLRIENFFNILNTIIKLTNDDKNYNLYKVKQIVSNYFMLIILEFEILFDKFLDKKNIFQNEINKYKTKKELGVFRQASSIRLLWPNLELDVVGISNAFIEDILISCETMSQNIQSKKILKKISDSYLLI